MRREIEDIKMTNSVSRSEKYNVYNEKLTVWN